MYGWRCHLKCAPNVCNLGTRRLHGLLVRENLRQEFIRRIKERDEKPLGTEFLRREKMNAHMFMKSSQLDSKSIGSSVLVALINLPSSSDSQQLEPYFLFTRRSFRLRSHPGEISFPGGKLDDNETPLQAALREAREEIGLKEENFDFWGAIKPVVATTSTKRRNTAALGHVGVVSDVSSLCPQTEEVKTIFTASLRELVSTVRYTDFRYTMPNGRPLSLSLPVFFTKQYLIISSTKKVIENSTYGYQIWGVTAVILHETICSLINPEEVAQFRL